MSFNPKFCPILPLTILALAGLLFACGGPSRDKRSATVQALAQSVALTATASSRDDVSSLDALKTAKAEATAQSQSAAATQTALAALNAEDQAATATAFAPYIDELTMYGVDPERGRPGWIHPPVMLDLEGYQQFDSKNQFIFTIARDFAISADITWNTQYGTSGCGFVLRSDGNEEKPNQYMIIATRGSLGHVLFVTMANGEIVGGHDIYAKGLDPEFDWHNDTTNRLTVVGRGTTITIFTNNTLIGEIDASKPPPQPILPPTPEIPIDTSDAEAMARYQQELEEYEQEVDQIQAAFQARMNASKEHDTVFERGFVALVALSESGHTTCRFDNAWLWLIEE